MDIYALSGFRGLGEINMCSDRASATQTILTLAGSLLASQGGKESSLDEAGAAITGATLQWTKRCAAAGASAAELAQLQSQIELQKAQLALQAQRVASEQAAARAEAAQRNQLIMLGIGGAAFVAVALVLRRD